MANTRNIGRGKAGYREFQKRVTQAYRMLVRSIKEGEEYFSDQIEDIFDQILLAFVQEMTDEELPNIDLWRKRAEQHVTKKTTEIFDKFGEENFPEEEKEEEQSETDEFPPPRIGDDFITIRGDEYPIITREEAPALRRNGRTPRNKVFRTLSEVEAYLYDVEWPREYIYQYGGIEIIRRGSIIVGYRIWIG